MKKIFLSTFLFVTILITTGAGYVGTLPNVEAEFSYLRKKSSEKSVAPYSVEELDKQNEKELKPVPLNNDSYVDIIIKKDKTSKYINDVNDVIFILEKLRKCLNTNQDIQKFNAIVSNLIDNIDYIRQEYYGKPEQNYLSYRKLLEISQQARDVASYRLNALRTQQYIPYTSPDNMYTKETLDLKMNNLLNSVNDLIYILKNLE